jgi:hypothetical protein
MFAEFEDDEDDYDAVEETPTVGVAGASGAPQAPGVVVPTVDAMKATAAAVAIPPAPPAVMVSVPAVAVPSASVAAVPAVATLAAAVATAKHVAKPRTLEERGKILRFTDLSHGAKAKRAAPPAKTHRKRKTAFSTHDDVFEEDDEVEDDSDEDEAPDDRFRPRRGATNDEWGSDDSDADESSDADSDADSDGPETSARRRADGRDVSSFDDDVSTKASGDGHFVPPRSHVPAEHVDWEDGIAWGSDSDSEEDAPPKPRKPKPEEAIPASVAPPATDPAETVKPKPKKMIVRFGCKPVAAATGAPGGGGGGGGGGTGRPGGGAPSNDREPSRNVTNPSKASTTNHTAGSARSTDRSKAHVVVTARARGWWGDLPETPLDQASVPFTRHAQFTRLWGEEAAIDENDARNTRTNANAETDVDDASTLTRESALARGVGAGAFGPDVPGDVSFIASQPGAGKTLLLRRNQKLTTGEWLDDVSWAPADEQKRRRGASYAPPPRAHRPERPQDGPAVARAGEGRGGDSRRRGARRYRRGGSPRRGAGCRSGRGPARLGALGGRARDRRARARASRRGGPGRVPAHLAGRRRGRGWSRRRARRV